MADILQFSPSNAASNGTVPARDCFFSAQKGASGTGKVTFHSHPFVKGGQWQNLTIAVSTDIDVQEVIRQVKENGGIWSFDGQVFIPWPCALVEVALDESTQAGG